jgi:hypothetical protein
MFPQVVASFVGPASGFARTPVTYEVVRLVDFFAYMAGLPARPLWVVRRSSAALPEPELMWRYKTRWRAERAAQRLARGRVGPRATA